LKYNSKMKVAIIFALFALFAASNAQNCGSCEIVIQIIETYVENNATEQQILQALDTLCTLFPQYQATCDQIASQTLGQIISYIEDNETPTQVCTQLGLCSSSSPYSVTMGKFNIPLKDVLKLQDLPKPSHTKGQGCGQSVECGSCEDVISVIETWLDQSGNQQEVITAVEIVCTYMPGWETTCDAIVAAGVPTVVNWIDTYENSTVVCNQLGMCGAVAEEKPTPVEVQSSDDCSECTQIVSTIENYLASNYSLSIIETYLDIACNFVPQWTSVCENFIVQELPQIIAMIEAEEDPQTICTSLGACSSKSNTILVI